MPYRLTLAHLSFPAQDLISTTARLEKDKADLEKLAKEVKGLRQKVALMEKEKARLGAEVEKHNDATAAGGGSLGADT